MHKLSKRFGIALAAFALIALLVVGAACDDDDSGNGNGEEPTAEEPGVTEEPSADTQAVEDAVSAAFDAWNGNDLEGLLAAFTDAGVVSQFEMTREEATEALAEGTGDPPITIGDFSDTQVSGDNASTVVALFYIGGSMGLSHEYSLVREGDAWLIDAQEPTVADPGTSTVVDLTLVDYGFEFDPAAITSGDFVLNTTSLGVDEHEVAIVGIAADADIEALADEFNASEEPPESFVGVAFGFHEGTEGSLVFSEPLAAGRYMMICFVPNAEDVPHYQLGMLNEFTIQ